MTPSFDPASLTMTEIIRLQTLLSQELTRRFERSAALAFTDIVDSTAYFAQFGDEAGRRVQQLHFDLLERCVGHAQGRIVDTAGDGAFACFSSAQAAASAMTALQNLISDENVNRPRAHQLCLRIGLHWGHVLTDGVQVTGDAVNLCARLAGAAQPGQIRLSRELFQELGQELRSVCRALGSVNLKGIVRSVDAFALLWRETARFPSEVVIRETGQRIVLPERDTVAFGRGETLDGAFSLDVALSLPDSTASRQISRRHFELRSRAQGYVLKALSTQATEVDGIAVARDQELLIRPGSCVRLAGVMTLDFVAPSLAGQAAIDETVCGPGVVSIG
ncbi:MAG: adenylate/guanylate cyclase domain-containing protein [Burkholderiaceae bacterium]